MNHSKYGLVFFLIAGIALLLTFLVRNFVIDFLLVWLSISCIWVSVAFWSHSPGMIMGKRTNGTIFLPFLVTNLPFLVTYWCAWAFRHLVLKHQPVHSIADTHVAISCWPIRHVPLSEFDLVIDVTSEMPKLYRTTGQYCCLPNIDGVPLDRFELPVEITRKMKILVHCAQGRGRSAVMTCLVLRMLEHAKTGEDAFRMVKNARPKVSVSKAQMQQINCF